MGRKPKRKSQGQQQAWKRKIEEQNWERWREEVDRKSSLKWVKEENGPERYIGSWEGHVSVWLQEFITGRVWNSHMVSTPAICMDRMM